MTIRFLKVFSVRRARRLLAAVLLTGCAVGLVGCAASSPRADEQDLSEALVGAGIGITDVEVSSRLDGFTRHIYVTCTFDATELAPGQFRQTIIAVSENLSARNSTKVQILFKDPAGGHLEGVEEAIATTNSELGLSGNGALGGYLSGVTFASVKDLRVVAHRIGGTA